MNTGLIVLWLAAFFGGLFGGLAWAYPRLPEDFYLRRWIDRVRGRPPVGRDSEASRQPADRLLVLGGVINLAGSVAVIAAVSMEGIAMDVVAVLLLITGSVLIHLRLRRLR